ncbi:unnamed protein product [Symbiodinium sp. CCMP2592]|nr:unnamed protein product [Symbiodinium sp. CCMP2592]
MRPSAKYPRLLQGLLDTADVQYLKGFFDLHVKTEWEKNEAFAASKNRPKPRRSLEYYTLLRHLHSEPRDPSLERIVSKVYAAIEKKLGPGFVIVHDFWSWRTPENVPAEFIHHDPDFWVAGRHDGFNLWILLDHADMSHSFDILVEEKNPKLYEIVGEKAGRLLPERDPKKKQNCPGLLFWDPLSRWPLLYEYEATRTLAMVLGVGFNMFWEKSQQAAMKLKKLLPTWAFRCFLFFTGWCFRLTPLPKGLELKMERFNMKVGDALVLRQYEMHTTDQDPLQPHQFRLAVGVKVLRQAPIIQYCYTGPASRTRRTYPCLRWGLWELLPDFYRQANLDFKPYPSTTLTRALFAATAEVALGDAETKA